MNKHTPGPWHVAPTRYNSEVRAGDMPLCEMRTWHYLILSGATDLNVEEAKAIQEVNARLIAAAPDLLEALQEVVAISDRKHAAWDKAHAAIAKAAGEEGGEA